MAGFCHLGSYLFVLYYVILAAAIMLAWIHSCAFALRCLIQQLWLDVSLKFLWKTIYGCAGLGTRNTVGGTLQSTTKSQLVTSDSCRGYDVMRGRVIPFKQAKDWEPLAKQNDLRTGCSAPESGIYSVTHSQHRLPREITLIREQSFPRCCKCTDPVYFKLVRPARSLDVNPHGFRMTLYELPELAEQQDESIAG